MIASDLKRSAKNMIILVLMAFAYFLAFVPLGAAAFLKAKKAGSLIATGVSFFILFCASRYFAIQFGIGQGNPMIPIVLAGGVGVLCLIIGAFLFFTSDENN